MSEMVKEIGEKEEQVKQLIAIYYWVMDRYQ